MTELSKTCLHDRHLAAGARMVDFGGWDMPLHYGSQIEEHKAVRGAAGMFDVSHMTVVDVTGAPDAPRAFLSRLLANDIARAANPGQALYTCMLNPEGGVIDDLIVYWLGGDEYRLVVNAATRERDLAWLQSVAGDFEVTVSERPELAMLAVQGPEARARALAALPPELQPHAESLRPFHAARASEWMVARTGYTGEDGWEIILPEAAAPAAWDALQQAGVSPAGLGARDTLRLEAGLNLYGSDMDETTTPFESNLGWTVDMTAQRDFIGEAALRAQQPLRQLTGLVLLDRGVLRGHQAVFAPDGEPLGEITSGGFAPTLERSIALARVASEVPDIVEVEIRGRRLRARVVNPPFVRKGKVRVNIEQ